MKRWKQPVATSYKLEPHFQKLDRVRTYPGMYIFPGAETYDGVSAYLLGYDHALEGALLIGFREWLVMRLGAGANLCWSALIPPLAFPKSKKPWKMPNTQEENRVAIDKLFELIFEFAAERGDDEAATKIRDGYEKWYEALKATW
jgi:hypothetical protein